MKEVMQKVINRQAAGIAFHDEMTDYYDFLCLEGFMCLHKCQFIEEAENLRNIKHFYINYFKTVPMCAKIETNVSIIPMDWPSHESTEITSTSLKTLTKTSLDTYLNWEKETLKLYQECLKKLKEEDCLAEYYEVLELMEDVEEEINEIKDLIIDLQAVDYDCKEIKNLQHKLKKEYKKHKCHM